MIDLALSAFASVFAAIFVLLAAIGLTIISFLVLSAALLAAEQVWRLLRYWLGTPL